MQAWVKLGILLTLLFSLGAVLSACGDESSTAPADSSAKPALSSTPPSYKFKGVERKSLMIDWDGPNPVIVEKQYITGPDRSSFSFSSGEHCEVEFNSVNKACAELVQLDEAKSGLRAKLVFETSDGDLEIPLSS